MIWMWIYIPPRYGGEGWVGYCQYSILPAGHFEAGGKVYKANLRRAADSKLFPSPPP